jgi:hypothetical protein
MREFDKYGIPEKYLADSGCLLLPVWASKIMRSIYRAHSFQTDIVGVAVFYLYL